jgi:hypothetical protein
MGTILENTTQEFSDGDQITSTNLNNLLTEATFKSTAVDQSSVTLVGGKIALPSTIPTRSFTSPTLNSPTVEGTFTVNASALGGTGIVIESEGIASNDNDTSLPTSAAVKDYVDTKITAEDLDFAGDTGTGAVDLDSQTLTIAGTANKIETSASGQTLTLTLPSTVNISTLDAGSIITTSIKAAINNSSRISIKGGNTAGAQIDLDGDTYASNGLATYSGLRHVFKNVAGSSTYAEINSSGVVTNTISEYGVGSGVTVDGLLLKDGGFTAAGTSTFAGQTISNLGTVTTANIDGGSIDGTTVGASSASTGAFTTLSTTGDFTPGGYITITDTTPLIRTSSNSENLTLRGGNTDAGGQIQLNGSTAASANKIFYFANEHEFWNTAVTEKIEFQGNSIYFGSAGDVKLYRSGADALKTDDSLEVVGDFNADSGTLFVDASANSVGIGTTSPAEKLEITGNAILDASNAKLKIKSGTGGTTGELIFTFNTDSTKYAGLEFAYDTRNSVGPRYWSANGYDLTVDSGNDLHIQTDSTDRITVLNGGNVGIGTTGPSYKLDVNSGTTNQVALFESTDATAYIELADNTGSVQLITPANGAFRIATGGAGAGSVGTSGLFIDQSQNVGIGDDTPSYKLDVNGTGRFVGQLTLDDELLHNISGTQTRLPGYYAGTYGVEIEQTAQGSTIHVGRSNGNCMNIGADATAAGTDVNVVYFRDTGASVSGTNPPVSVEVGKIVINTTSTNYSTSSDYRLKENEVLISDGIDRLKQLNAYRFNFIKEPSKVVDGFFAHEVSPVVPESIVGTKDEVDDDGNPVYQGIDQSKLVPLLTAALQEAVAKIEALEARVAVLEG